VDVTAAVPAAGECDSIVARAGMEAPLQRPMPLKTIMAGPRVSQLKALIQHLADTNQDRSSINYYTTTTI